MKEHNFVVGGDESGQRLDHYLAGHLSGLISRSYIQKLIKDGQIKVDNQVSKSHYRLKGGERILVIIPLPVKSEVNPEDIPLNIVYEDEYLIVLNKPAGMVVHPAAGNSSGTLVNALLHYCSDLSGIGGELKPGIVHRLDKDTSGLMVVAKKDSAHAALAKQFKDRRINKRYMVIVKGNMALEEGVVDEPIGRNLRQRKKMEVVQAGGKQAVTYYKVIKRIKDFTLLEVIPKTGRTHQIRVHMAYLGHTVMGDSHYGRRSPFIGRQAIHAISLGFYHPAAGKYMEFNSDLPEDMKKLVV
ncbi:MAG: RluA family pseudouridine synthase [Candidatus Omnitrophota bacterium]|nr:RluA family pseudouridine synthase [Candidatus Omnitrophota bacterium]